MFTYDDFSVALPRCARPVLGVPRFSRTPAVPDPALGWRPDAVANQTRVRMWGDVWDAYKLITNPYWLVNPTRAEVQLVAKKTGVQVRPLDERPVLSRAYHKMLEILHRHRDLVPPPGTPRVTGHVAEAPGGFVQAIAEFGVFQDPDRQIGMSILERESYDARIPKFDPSAPSLPRTFRPVYGETKTGDVCRAPNLEAFAREFPDGAQLVTGDGGFEVSDWILKEARVAHLLLCQFMASYRVLRPGGSFVCKLYSAYTRPTAQILAIVSSVFRTMTIEKPPTSRVSNTENYIVCRGFDGRDEGFWRELVALAETMTREDPICGADEKTSPVLVDIGGVVLQPIFTDALRRYNVQTEGIKERVAAETYDLIVRTMHHSDRRAIIQEIVDRNKKIAQDWVSKHLGVTIVALADGHVPGGATHSGRVPIPHSRR